MRLILIFVAVLLSGCQSILPKQEQPQTQRPNQYEFFDYPKPEVRKTECITGRIRSITTGPDAIVLSVISPDGNMANMRFPFTYLLTIQIPNDTVFCYDYFEVGG